MATTKKKAAVVTAPRKGTARSSSRKTASKAASKDTAFSRQFRDAIIGKLDGWVEATPQATKPLIGTAGGKTAKTLSPKDIALHVKKRTPLGEKVVANWAELALRSIKATPLV
jgi:hypothetical protein